MVNSVEANLIYRDQDELQRLLRKGSDLSIQTRQDYGIYGGVLLKRNGLVNASELEHQVWSCQRVGWVTHFIEAGTVRLDYSSNIYLTRAKEKARDYKRLTVMYYGSIHSLEEFNKLQKKYNLEHYSYLITPEGEITENEIWFEDEDHLHLKF